MMKVVSFFSGSIFMSFVLIIIILSSARSTERMVLAEFFNNTGCPYCPPARQVLNQLALDYDSNFVSIRYHVWWPSGNDPFWLYNQVESQTRNNFYGNNYTPHGYFDGLIDGSHLYGTWPSIVLDRISVDSPLEITCFSSFDSDSLTGNLHIYITATSDITQSELKLRIAVTEDSLYYAGETYNQVFRDMIPDTYGIPFDIDRGETVDFYQQYGCPAPLIYQNCEIVIFVQSELNREILQSCRIRIPEDVTVCDYVVGDVNNSGGYNGLDIVYSVNYFKGIGPIPQFECECPLNGFWFVAGDVNGSCDFNGLDITFGVAFFKGQQTELLPCPDCPPVGE